MKIAIIGSGIAGNSIAWLLKDDYEIKIFEKNNYIGGHSNTVSINYNDKKIEVDTGFIVFNHQTYPNLKKLFEILGVKTFKSDMSFGISCKENDFEYSVLSLKSLFAKKSNIFNFRFLRMLFDIIKFNKKARKFIAKNQDLQDDASINLGDFLRQIKVGQYFMQYFLLPMASAIWSCKASQMLKYPALSFLRFYHNHGLLTILNQPQWYTVLGGSKEYVKLLTEKFQDKIVLNSKIIAIKKENDKIAITNENNETELFDKVIFASHADEVLEIAKNCLPQKAISVLQNFKFQENLAILHKDENFMPKRKSAYASWVYLRHKNDEEKCCVSYNMNFLQKIDAKYPLFVTLNPPKSIDEDKVFAKFIYHHPIFDQNAIKAQNQIQEIQGLDGFYYVGAYQANGFHEDGLLSSIKVAKLFNINKL